MMKKTIFRLALLSVAFMGLFVACNEDENEEKVSPFVGNYVISNAEVATALELNTTIGAKIPVPVGTNITSAIQMALLGSVECSSAGETWIELRKDQSIHLSCKGANALNAGTWEEVSAGELKLNLNNAAIPSSPTGIALTVTDVATSTAGVTGKTSVPLPKAIFTPFLAGTGLTLADNPPVYLVNFSIEFQRQ